MNNIQKLLFNLLSAAIRNKKPNNAVIKPAALSALFNEASDHHVQTLLYPIVKDMELLKGLNEKIKQDWRKDTILHAIIQTKHINQMMNVIKLFNDAHIPVVILKGLVLRELYPTPEFRIMTDADILVHREDIDAARALLLYMGYYEGDCTPMHICFKHSSHLTIELHWKLTDARYVKIMPHVENSLWTNTVPCKFHGLSVMTLSPENHLLYLCLHMLTHIAGCGFGIRQICDFVLFYEANENAIDWSFFYKKVEECGIERFTSAIFIICNNLFDINIPGVFRSKNVNEDRNLGLLVNDIISGGIYGKRVHARMYGSFLSVIFPSREKLPKRYSYAKKHILLVPVAWMHHIICGLFNKSYRLYDKLIFLFSLASVTRKRAKLLRWLNL